MSDFVSDFWNLWVAGVTLVSVIGCGIFLWAVSIKRTTAKVDTTGHVWDETLSEWNNPLPSWWSWLFYITVVFALVYLVLFPGLGSFKGVLGWTSAGQWEGEMKHAAETYDPIFDKYLKMDVKAVAADPEGNVPWFGCGWIAWFPQPERQGLVVWWRPRNHQGQHYQWS